MLNGVGELYGKGSGPLSRKHRQLLPPILRRSLRLPLAVVEGNVTKNLKTGVRLWTDPSFDQDRKISAQHVQSDRARVESHGSSQSAAPRHRCDFARMQAASGRSRAQSPDASRLLVLPPPNIRRARSSTGRAGSKTASSRGRPSIGDPGKSNETTLGRLLSSSSSCRKLTDVARTSERSCSSKRSLTIRGSRTAANPLVSVCNSVAVAHDFSWPPPDAHGPADGAGAPDPEPDTVDDEREEGTRILSA